MRDDIVGGLVNTGEYVQPLHTSPGVRSNSTSDWIARKIAGNSEYGRVLGANFADLVRNNYNLDDRYKRAWLLNVGYNWPLDRTFMSREVLPDHLVVLVVLTLRDSATGSTVGRRLMAAASHPDGGRKLLQIGLPDPVDAQKAFVDSLNALGNSPSVNAVPPITLNVNVADQIGRAMIQSGQPFAVVNITLAGLFRQDMSPTQVREEVERRLRSNMKTYCKNCNAVQTAFYNLERVSTPTNPARRLMGTSDATYNGSMTVVYTFGSGSQVILFDEMFRSLIDIAYSGMQVPKETISLANAITSGQLLLIEAEQLMTQQLLSAGNTTILVRGVSNEGYTQYKLVQASTTGKPLPAVPIDLSDFSLMSSSAIPSKIPFNTWFSMMLFLLASLVL